MTILPCDDCNKKVRTIVKMGGLLCARCRKILKYPGEPEYQEALKKIREKIASEK